MAKAKTQYVCNQCGSVFAKWAGQCADCGAWNSLAEFNPDRGLSSQRGNSKSSWAGEARTVTTMEAVKLVAEPRTVTGSAELDRVLGGGLVEGSVVLIGGDPGIGKSTILLQGNCHKYCNCKTRGYIFHYKP